MDKTQFNSISHTLVETAMALGLDIELKANFNDEVGFIIDFGIEAIDYETLENPTSTNIASYLVITMPKVVRGDEAEQTGMDILPYDEMIGRYHHAATLVSDEPFEYDREDVIKGRKFQYSDVENYEIERDPDLDAGGEDTATYAAEGIVWDCDGVSPEEYGLPKSDIIEAEGELYVADRLSDKYGFCIVAIESIKELD